eukprot:6185165-Pleurochrysis_carterae.AAC.3
MLVGGSSLACGARGDELMLSPQRAASAACTEGIGEHGGREQTSSYGQERRRFHAGWQQWRAQPAALALVRTRVASRDW